MEALVPIFGMMVPVAIVWIVMHYKERRRMREGIPAAVNASNAQLLAVADKMERRIDALEQILDAEAPGWRKRHHHEHS